MERYREYRVTIDDNHLVALPIKNHLVMVYNHQGKLLEEERFRHEFVAETKSAFGDLSPRTLTSMQVLARLMSDRGKYIDAEAIYLDCWDKLKALALRKSSNHSGGRLSFNSFIIMKMVMI